MSGKTIIELAVDLSAGVITSELIRKTYGDSVLTSVLSIGAGIGVGVVANQALKVLDDHTGIVSDLGSLVDDVFSIF